MAINDFIDKSEMYQKVFSYTDTSDKHFLTLNECKGIQGLDSTLLARSEAPHDNAYVTNQYVDRPPVLIGKVGTKDLIFPVLNELYTYPYYYGDYLDIVFNENSVTLGNPAIKVISSYLDNPAAGGLPVPPSYIETTTEPNTGRKMFRIPFSTIAIELIGKPIAYTVELTGLKNSNNEDYSISFRFRREDPDVIEDFQATLTCADQPFNTNNLAGVFYISGVGRRYGSIEFTREFLQSGVDQIYGMDTDPTTLRMAWDPRQHTKLDKNYYLRMYQKNLFGGPDIEFFGTFKSYTPELGYSYWNISYIGGTGTPNMYREFSDAYRDGSTLPISIRIGGRWKNYDTPFDLTL